MTSGTFQRVPGNLEGIRVLDLTAEPGFFTGKVLADLGADVIKIEPPAGEPSRRRGPFIGGHPDPERSVLWLALNTGKRGITLDLATPRGREVFRRLCDTADAIIDSSSATGPPTLARLALTHAALSETNPSLVLCTISPFGQTGPYRAFRASDITALAMGGNLYPTGNPDRAPVRCSLPVAYYHAGIEAAVGIVFALWGCAHSGRGQSVDVSLQEAMMMANMTLPAQYPLTGNRGSRTGATFRGGHAVFREIWPCGDGHVSFALRGGPARVPGIARMVDYMDEHGMAPAPLKERDWSTYNHNLVSQADVDEIEGAITAFFATKTMQELFDAACERNLMLAPANTAREVLASRQLAAREFFVEIDEPGMGARLTYPGPFARSSREGIGMRRRAPRLGEHNAEVYGGIQVDAAALAAAGVV